MSLRGQLRAALSQYVTETFTYINNIKKFIQNHEEWIKDRESESKAMVEIKTRNNRRLNPETKTQSFKNMMRKRVRPARADREEADLETGLSKVLDLTLADLQLMHTFLNAVESLSVTTVQVFQPNSVINMSEEDLREVQEIINDCIKICPLLLLFKRDNKAFFSPRLQNIDALQHQLDTYIININYICNLLTNSALGVETPDLQLNEGVSEEDMRNMLTHIHQLQELREDEDFRMVFLFQEKHDDFVKEYYQRRPHMDTFLSKVEKCAKKLDSMKKGKQISGVVSGSLGATGGVLAIVGLALLPVTLGASTILIGTGAGMAVASGGTNIATLVADRTVNKREQGKAKEAFEKFKDDMNDLQECLNNICNINLDEGKWRRSMEDAFNFASAFTKGTQSATHIGKAAASGAEAITRGASAGLIAVNVLFIGFDVATIVVNGRGLHRGRESQNSKVIRARAALWKSEIDSWEKIYKSLEQGLQSSEEKLNVLKTPFYPQPPFLLQPFKCL